MKRKICGISVSLILINLAAILERADENLLPAVYKEIGQTFHASPSQLGSLTFIRALVQALSSPLAGILAMRYHRPSVIGIGTLFWGFSTALVAFSQNLTQCAIARAINGIGLAIVIPALQSFIADSYLETGRGFAFGWLNLVGSFGGIGGSMTATIMAGYTFGGIPGWRLAFVLVALMSCSIGWLVHVCVVDPESAFHSSISRHSRSDIYENLTRGAVRAWEDTWTAVTAVVKIRTFQIIILQGLVGSLPWTAMVFFTLWLELIGKKIWPCFQFIFEPSMSGVGWHFSDVIAPANLTGFGHKGAATLTGLFSAGCAFGALWGGWLGDQAARRFPGTGRVICGQFSAAMGVPFSYFLLVTLKQDPSNWLQYGIVLFMMGLTISWCQSCANNPMFAEIVPARQRTIIYAFDRAFEGSFSAIAAPTVGILAEKVWGYSVDKAIPETGSPQEAEALSRGLVTVMAIPFALCALCYTPLYMFYKRDREYARTYQSLDLE